MTKCTRTEKDAEKMTLAGHAEAWWREQGNTVPSRESAEWNAMYAEWVEFAFTW